MSKVFAVVASVAVGAAIIAGLFISGRPEEQRLLRFDEVRLQDLSRLAADIGEYYKATRELPANLEQLKRPAGLTIIPVDPLTAKTYAYEPVAADEYRLCAEFARPSGTGASQDFWQHDAGYHCFSVSVTPGNPVP